MAYAKSGRSGLKQRHHHHHQCSVNITTVAQLCELAVSGRGEAVERYLTTWSEKGRKLDTAERNSLLAATVESRVPSILMLITRNLSPLSVEESSALLFEIAFEGLHDFVFEAAALGLDIGSSLTGQGFRKGHNHFPSIPNRQRANTSTTMIEIAVEKDDYWLLVSVWRALLHANLDWTVLRAHLDRAIILALRLMQTQPNEKVINALMRWSDGLAKRQPAQSKGDASSGDALLRTANTHPQALALAKVAGLGFSRQAIILAGKECDSPFLEALLTLPSCDDTVVAEIACNAASNGRFDNLFACIRRKADLLSPDAGKELSRLLQNASSNVKGEGMKKLQVCQQSIKDLSGPKVAELLRRQDGVTLSKCRELAAILKSLKVNVFRGLPATALSHQLAVLGLLRCIPEASLMTYGDDGLRPIDILIAQIDESDVSDVASLIAERGDIEMPKLLTNRFFDVTKSRSGSVQMLLAKYIEMATSLNKKWGQQFPDHSILAALRGLCRCDEVPFDWKSILKIKKIQEILADPKYLMHRDDESGSTILMSACGSPTSLVVAETILRSKCATSDLLMLRNRTGQTAAHCLMACWSAARKANTTPGLMPAIHVERIVPLLLKCLRSAPALIASVDGEGMSLFHVACKYGVLPAAVLLSNFSPANTMAETRDKFGRNALHIAVSSDKPSADIIVYLTRHCQVSVNAFTMPFEDNTDDTQIFEPGQRGVPCKDASDTPLHLAGRNSKVATTQLLLDLGANPSLRNTIGEPALYTLLENGDESMWKSLSNHPATVRLAAEGELLSVVSLNPKMVDSGLPEILTICGPNEYQSECLRFKSLPPLVAAAHRGNWRAITTLLTEGGDITLMSNQRMNPLHSAASAGSAPAMVALLKYANNVLPTDIFSTLLLQEDDDGDTPLHIAARAGHDAICQLLLQHALSTKATIGQLLSLKNHAKMTARALAAEGGHRSIACLLAHAAGANDVSMSQAEKATASQLLDQLRRRPHHEVVLPESSDGSRVRDNANETSKEETKSSFQFPAHVAFGSVLVRSTLAANSKTSVAKQIIAIGQSSNQNPHLLSFITGLLVNVSVSDWDSTLRLHATLTSASSWSSRKGEIPPPGHPLWDWLVTLSTPRTIYTTRLPDMCDLLGAFVVQLNRLGLIDHLRSAATLMKDYRESEVNEPLKQIVDFLKEVAQSTSSRNPEYIAHRLAAVGSGFLKNEVKDCPMDAHWTVIEATITTSKDGVTAAGALADLQANASLSPAERSFILSTIRAYITNGPSTALRAYVAVASTCLLESSLAECLALQNAVLGRLKTFKNDGPVPPLTAVTKCYAAATDCRNITNITDLVKKTNAQSFTALLDALSAYVQSQQNIAPDRDLKALIRCFIPSQANLNFKPHLFSFDGTPVIALPDRDREIIERVLQGVESFFATKGVVDEAAVAYDCRDASASFAVDPSEQLLIRMVANAREGCLKILGKKPYLVQCAAVIAFMLPALNSRQPQKGDGRDMKGRLGQIGTGEGKSIIVAMTAILFALQGKNVDIITTSQSLAQRDAKEFEPLLAFFGLTGGSIAVAQPTRLHFNHAVVYGTNTDFEFAQLREGVFGKKIRFRDRDGNGSWSRRQPQVAIVDESDSLFLDMARNSARIASPTGMSFVWAYAPIFKIVESSGPVPPTATKVRAVLAALDNGSHQSALKQCTDEQLTKWVEAARVALARQLDKDYVIRGGRVVIVDHQNTGRLQIQSRWSNGIHEMVEVKEGLHVEPQSGTIASISHPSFFEGYSTLIGITGTAGEPEERREITDLFTVDSFDVPPHRPCMRKRWPTAVFGARESKWASMVKSVKEVSRTRAVLIIVPTIAESKQFSALLLKDNLRHLTLNEEQQEAEDLVVYKAGDVGSITVATNTAGRGTDIRLTRSLVAAGGLHVIVGFFPANLRVECQALGRSGRQGQPGSNQIFVSLDEEFVVECLLKNMITSSTQSAPAKALSLLLSACCRERTGDQNHEILDEANSVWLVEQLYVARTKHVLTLSEGRRHAAAAEHFQFAVLEHFVEDWAMLTSVNSPLSANSYDFLAALQPFQVSASDFGGKLTESFRTQWVLFFTELSDPQHRSAPPLANPTAIAMAARDSYERFLNRCNWRISTLRANTLEDISATIKATFDMAMSMDTMKAPFLKNAPSIL